MIFLNSANKTRYNLWGNIFFSTGGGEEKLFCECSICLIIFQGLGRNIGINEFNYDPRFGKRILIKFFWLIFLAFSSFVPWQGETSNCKPAVAQPSGASTATSSLSAAQIRKPHWKVLFFWLFALSSFPSSKHYQFWFFFAACGFQRWGLIFKKM